jgi:hypothetical protein
VSEPPDDDLVPASVRLGNVVPPEDPEDWTRPLTWAAAVGILGAPLLAAGWFLVAPPVEASLVPGTTILAATLAAGAALTGSTQIGALRAFTATLGAGLLGALVLVVVGTSLPRATEVLDGYPAAAHAIRAAAAGMGGVVAASGVAPLLAGLGSRILRAAAPAFVGVAVALLLVPLLG